MYQLSSVFYSITNTQTVTHIATCHTASAALQAYRQHLIDSNTSIMNITSAPACVIEVANNNLKRIPNMQITLGRDGVVYIDGEIASDCERIIITKTED